MNFGLGYLLLGVEEARDELTTKWLISIIWGFIM